MRPAATSVVSHASHGAIIRIEGTRGHAALKTALVGAARRMPCADCDYVRHPGTDVVDARVRADGCGNILALDLAGPLPGLSGRRLPGRGATAPQRCRLALLRGWTALGIVLLRCRLR